MFECGMFLLSMLFEYQVTAMPPSLNNCESPSSVGEKEANLAGLTHMVMVILE